MKWISAQPRGGEGGTKHPTENGKTNNTLIPISIWINAFSGSTTQAPMNLISHSQSLQQICGRSNNCGSLFYRSAAPAPPVMLSVVRGLLCCFPSDYYSAVVAMLCFIHFSPSISSTARQQQNLFGHPKGMEVANYFIIYLFFLSKSTYKVKSLTHSFTQLEERRVRGETLLFQLSESV